MTITEADPLHAEIVANVLAQAFHDDPVVGWLVPDEHRRPTVMTQFFTVIVADALEAGSVDVYRADDGQPLAAATWFDQSTPASEPQEPALRFDEIFGPDLSRWRTLDRLMTDNHFQGPHHYLFAIGVRPDLRGHGLGGQLLDHRRQALSLDPAYLEATSRDSMRLYQRKGYVLLSELRIPDGPSMWRMWLPPENARSTST